MLFYCISLFRVVKFNLKNKNYKENNIKGKIVKIESKDYYVENNIGKVFRCSLRGKFKKDLLKKKDKLTTYDVAVLGDWVEFEIVSGSVGVINKIEIRKNYLSRKAKRLRGSLKRGERLEQIIASNLDTLYIVSSIDSPKFNNRFIDRIIVTAESSHIDVRIVINKSDLEQSKLLAKWENFYSKLGYNVFITSVISLVGIEKLKKSLNGKINLFWGQSGVGKSSLLNAMYPELNFPVGEISEASKKGRHTTVTGIMKLVEKNTYIIDTPGIREIDPYGIKKQDLGYYFIEFGEFIHQCKFNTCIHVHEPGCAVVKAVEEGKISLLRYESYLNLLNTIEDDMFY